MSTNTFPVIAGVSIRVNSSGLFNLNDLHQASGGEKRHQVSDWMRLQDVQQHIALLEEKHGKRAVESIRGGANNGTFAHENLIYRYAMWISPGFYDQVIETFKAVISGDLDRALTEAQLAKIAFYEDAKKNKALRITERTADRCIAEIRGDQSTLDRLDREERNEQQWRENTAEGFVATRMDRVWAGYEEVVEVPLHLDAEEVRSEIVKFLKKRKLKAEIELFDYYGNKRIRVETW